MRQSVAPPQLIDNVGYQLGNWCNAICPSWISESRQVPGDVVVWGGCAFLDVSCASILPQEQRLGPVFFSLSLLQLFGLHTKFCHLIPDLSSQFAICCPAVEVFIRSTVRHMCAFRGGLGFTVCRISHFGSASFFQWLSHLLPFTKSVDGPELQIVQICAFVASGSCFPSMPFLLAAVMQISGGDRSFHLWSVSLGTILIFACSASPMHFWQLVIVCWNLWMSDTSYWPLKTEVHVRVPTQGA